MITDHRGGGGEGSKNVNNSFRYMGFFAILFSYMGSFLPFGAFCHTFLLVGAFLLPYFLMGAFLSLYGGGGIFGLAPSPL